MKNCSDSLIVDMWKLQASFKKGFFDFLVRIDDCQTFALALKKKKKNEKENCVSFMLDLKWLCIAEAEEDGCIGIWVLLVKVLVLLKWSVLKVLLLANNMNSSTDIYKPIFVLIICLVDLDCCVCNIARNLAWQTGRKNWVYMYWNWV